MSQWQRCRTAGAVLVAQILASVAWASAQADPAAIARGRYLAEAVLDCQGCHTRRDPRDFSRPLGPEWAGGEEFGAEWGLPGRFVTPNVTSDIETGVGTWTDAEFKNAIRNGVNRAGERLFPLMPSHFYQTLSDPDLDDVIAYLRSVAPARKPNPETTELAIPRAALPALPPVTEVSPPANDPVSRGRYVFVLANCLTCHSPSERGQLIAARYAAGGVRITAPFGTIVTPNITPAPRTGIAAYTEADFIRLMRDSIKRDGNHLYLNYMPTYVYKHMTDADLKAMYAYLRTLAPIENDIDNPVNQFPLGN